MTSTQIPDDRTTQLTHALDAISRASRDTAARQRITKRAVATTRRADAIVRTMEKLEALYCHVVADPTQAGSLDQLRADATDLVDACEAIRHPKELP